VGCRAEISDQRIAHPFLFNHSPPHVSPLLLRTQGGPLTTLTAVPSDAYLNLPVRKSLIEAVETEAGVLDGRDDGGADGRSGPTTVVLVAPADRA